MDCGDWQPCQRSFERSEASALQLHVLRHSKHPCAALFNGTLGSSYQSTDDFPFADFAADAFEADVSEKVKELLED